mmetsp:Transcript_65771/g.212212  ORF Transcript_65771/g.212212 Transcript_65771/m.212212 type:complete len:220 (+) Transcript_65771:144-803(+)
MSSVAMQSSMVVLAVLDGLLVHQIVHELGLPPVGGRVAPNGAPVHGLCLGVHLHRVLAELRPVDEQLRAVQRPVRVRGEVRALEVVVAVGLELDGEAAARPCEVPLRAGAVTDQQGLHGAQGPEEGELAPVLLVLLFLGYQVARHGLRLLVDLELVLPELGPVHVHAVALQLPPRGRLELGAEEVAGRPEADLEAAAAPADGVPADDVLRLELGSHGWG